MHFWLNVTLIISDCEVWIDVFLRDHGVVKLVPLHSLVWVNSTEKLNELKRQKQTEEK